MKKYMLLIASLFVGSAAALHAQTAADTVQTVGPRVYDDTSDLPEGMLHDADSLLNLYNTKQYLTEENCNYRDENPQFPRETYVERLRRMPTIMEMPYNDVVRKFIDRYAERWRSSVSYMLGASNFYMPIFEQALEANDLPLELKYLPVIESALDPKDTSAAGAAGLWQFLVQTGRDYGLEVNSLVDERLDVVKSSYAAARMLKDLYKIYGDWNLVIAAYNCGPGTINKAMHRAGGATDYWTIYPYLPKETQGYVPAFIAANYIMNYYCEHNICPMRTQLPAKSDTIMVNRDVHFKQIAAVTGISVDELRTLNPQYRRDIVNGMTKPSPVRLPQNYIASFIDHQDSIYAYEASKYLTKRAEVAVAAPVEAKKETPTHQRSTASASRSSRESASRNSYSRSRQRETASRQRQGSRSSSASRSQSSRSKSSRSRRNQPESVTIKQGETLTSLAKKHGTTVDKLRKMNGIKGDNIRAGKSIRVK